MTEFKSHSWRSDLMILLIWLWLICGFVPLIYYVLWWLMNFILHYANKGDHFYKSWRVNRQEGLLYPFKFSRTFDHFLSKRRIRIPFLWGYLLSFYIIFEYLTQGEFWWFLILCYNLFWHYYKISYNYFNTNVFFFTFSNNYSFY